MESGWQVRCPKCGAFRAAEELGMKRAGAASKGKRTLMRCWSCRRFVMAHVERERPKDPR